MTATKKDNEALLPQGWPRPKGYANGVAARGRQVYVAGKVGWDAAACSRATTSRRRRGWRCDNIAAVLRAGGARPEHIVRMTWYVTSKREYLAAGRAVGAAYREIIGNFDIAMTAVEVTALMEDRAKVEIEVTAVVPD